MASYVSGSGTTELLFEYTLFEADWENNTMLVPSNSLALNGGNGPKQRRYRRLAQARTRNERDSRSLRPAPGGARLLVGSFEGSHDGLAAVAVIPAERGAIVHDRRGRHAARLSVRGTNFKCTTMVSHPLPTAPVRRAPSSPAPTGSSISRASPWPPSSTWIWTRAPRTGWWVEGPGFPSGASRTSENGMSGWSLGRPDADQDGQWIVERRLVRPRDAHRDLRHPGTTSQVLPRVPQDLGSNLDNTDSAGRSVANSSNSYAQSFSTGSSWATLTAVKMVGGFARDARVSIYSDSSGAPGSCVAALQNPDDLMGTDADDGTSPSAPALWYRPVGEHEYWVVLETAGQWRRTGETKEAGTSGWSHRGQVLGQEERRSMGERDHRDHEDGRGWRRQRVGPHGYRGLAPHLPYQDDRRQDLHVRQDLTASGQ